MAATVSDIGKTACRYTPTGKTTTSARRAVLRRRLPASPATRTRSHQNSSTAVSVAASVTSTAQVPADHPVAACRARISHGYSGNQPALPHHAVP